MSTSKDEEKGCVTWIIIFFVACFVCGIAGALIGYGNYGDLQSTALGAGVGLIAIPVIIIVLLYIGN